MSSGHAAKTKQTRKKTAPRYGRLTYIGLILLGAACFIVITTYWPIIRAELGYEIRRATASKSVSREFTPIDHEYGIVIPKIGANAHVIANVDPFDSRAYQMALTRGVAQARGTGTPGNPGNVFLFAHSSENFYYATRYNSVFYLLTKLEKGDEIILYYKNTKYFYTVTDKTMVKPNAVSYLNAIGGTRQTVTLMTCWPPGTSYARLLIIAERVI